MYRFVDDVKADNRDIWNNNKFIVKIPYVGGGFLKDKKSIKYAKGVQGIIKAIWEFTNPKNYPGLLGYIPFLIIQPRFSYTKEAKASDI